MPDVPVTNYLQKGTFPVHQLEKITSAPLSIFNKQQLEVLAFPTLYPDGNNGFGTHRQISITPLDYFQSRIMSKDSRWAKHLSYIFWACNIVEAIKLQSQSIALRLRNPTSGRKNKQKKTLTAGDLRSTGVGENPDVRENCYSFMRDIKGTAAYWQSARIQLFAMLRTLGPPTFFITFSADDHHWKDLMVVLASCSGRNISNEQVDELSNEERRTLMTSNPVVTARHFQHRFQSLVKEIIKESGRPIGEVTDFFWRVEFQLRGSPHIHSLWWIKDAPNLDTVEGRTAAPDFIDRYISARIPEEGSSEDSLRSVVLRVQKHSHTSTCIKKDKRKKSKECRFDFPQPLSSTTRLKNNEDVGNKSRFYILRRTDGEENVNPYNAPLLLAWQANMDIQLIGSVYGTASYICSYMCKGESEEAKKAISDSLQSLAPNASLQKRLSKLGNTMLLHRQLSGQEAAYRLCHLPLKDSSRKVVFVNTVPPEKRTRILKNRSELLELDDMDTNLFQPGLFNRYAARPQEDEFEKMTLAHFSVWYDSVYRDDTPKGSSGRHIQPRFKLQGNLGWIKLRTKQACLRTPIMTPQSHGDEYYYSLLLLYIPWRREKEDLLLKHDSALSAFIAREKEMKVLNCEHHTFAEEVQRVVQQLQAVSDGAYMDLVAPNVQHGEREDATHVPEELDHGLHNAENYVQDEQVDVDALPTVADDDNANGTLTRMRLTDKAFTELVCNLNAKQREAFDMVVQYTSSLHKFHLGQEAQPKPIRIFITGGAGTGKSYVIRAIREHIERSVQGSDQVHGCMVMAPTGVAAFNVDGLTIHRALNLQVEHRRSAYHLKLTTVALRELRMLWRGIHTIIIDEISMVSYEVLQSVHYRLCEKFANDDIFGGLNMIAVGDFYQLSPVNGHFVFSVTKLQSKRLASHLWKDCFQIVELTENVRQQKDSSFSDLLNRIRVGKQTEQDVKLLESRMVVGNNIDLSKPPFEKALRLFPHVADCNAFNEGELIKLSSNTPIFEFEADHVLLENRRSTYGAVSYEKVTEELIPEDDKECGGLPRRLKMALGAEVMLRRNIKCGDGLVNGAQGVIVGFKWGGKQNTQPSHGALPEIVYVKFHDPRFGQFTKVCILNGQQEAVAIEPLSVRFYGRQGTVLQRTQIPLILCWAATLHKVQGLSLDSAVLDLGEKVFEAGMSYVALSWVRTLNGIALVKFEPKKLYANKRVDKEMEHLRSTQHAVACSQPSQDNYSEVLPVDLSQSQEDEPPTSLQDISMMETDLDDFLLRDVLEEMKRDVRVVQLSSQEIRPTCTKEVREFMQNIEDILKSKKKESLEELKELMEDNKIAMKTLINEVNKQENDIFNVETHVVNMSVQKELLPSFTSQYVPVRTTGDGNCMYNTISIALHGTEEYTAHLRAITVYSLLENKEHMSEVMKPSTQLLLRNVDRNEENITAITEREWIKLLQEAAQDQCWGNHFHLHALCLMLKRPIYMYGYMQHRSVGELGRVDVNSSSVEIERLFQQKDRRMNNHIEYLPSVEDYPAIRGFLDSSHFTALLPTMSTSHFFSNPLYHLGLTGGVKCNNYCIEDCVHADVIIFCNYLQLLLSPHVSKGYQNLIRSSYDAS